MLNEKKVFHYIQCKCRSGEKQQDVKVCIYEPVFSFRPQNVSWTYVTHLSAQEWPANHTTFVPEISASCLSLHPPKGGFSQPV